MDRLKLKFSKTFFRSLLVAVIGFGASFSCSAQVFRGGLGIDMGVRVEDKPDTESGGVLKTDPDLESILQQAERIKNDGNYRVASQLWQAVLQRSGDSLYSEDGKTYFSLVQQVEAILANLPPEGLQAYRVLADAEVKEILAQATGPSDTEALNKIVRSYFVSSLGDEAAYSLGCIFLDRYDFIGARRLFEKIATQHPDPTMPMDEVYSRIALCQAFLGDVNLAEESLKQATDINGSSEQPGMIRRSLAQLAASNSDLSYLTSWNNPMGDARRYGTMPPLPKDTMSQDLAAVWQFYFDPQEAYLKAADVNGAMLTGGNASGAEVLQTVDDLEEELITSWRKKTWRPTGHLLIDGDRVFFKTGSDIAVWNRKKISKLAKQSLQQTTLEGAIEWRSAWHNIFRLDEVTRSLEMFRPRPKRNRRKKGDKKKPPSLSPIPTGLTEVQLFGDQIYQQMSIHQKNLYAIEGESFGVKYKAAKNQARPQLNFSIRRTRLNFLTAYDSVSGRVQWTLPRKAPEGEEHSAEEILAEGDSPWISNAGFMAAPIGYGDTIIVPVNTGGAISIYALDPNQEGKTIWKSFLCDEPLTGAAPWSAINLSIEGSDLFVSCGLGVVFVLDPASGTIRFAKRYERAGTRDSTAQRNNRLRDRLTFSGWSSDIIVPYRRQMICFNSDSETIVAYDRNSGKAIWRTETTPIGFKVDYILGVYNDMLYAAGTETIIAYDLAGHGRMVWGAEQVFDGKQSLGRGMLTPDGIYMPVEDTIYQFDLNGDQGDAKIIAKSHVDLGTLAPVGNLYSDGERLWVHGANRLYALGPAEEAGKADPSKKGVSKKPVAPKPSVSKTDLKQTDEEKIDRHLKAKGIAASKTLSGLRYVINKEGEGPRVPVDSTVSVHYHGTLLDGTVFDSSIERGGEAPQFKLASLIPGWQEGIRLLNKGSKATLYIPSKLAYGDHELPKIKANSVLKFDVELVDF